MLLELDHVSYAYPRDGSSHPRLAVQDVSLGVAKGEFVAILGASGCGKSTLLRIAAGLQHPTVGRALFEGRRIQGPARERGIVFQAFGSFPWLTVEQNIGLGLKKLGHPEVEAGRRLKAVLELVGLSDFRHAFPRELSGGMQQRLALGRSISAEPTLLLLDEPFSAVDAITRRRLQQGLKEILESVRITALLVTHDVEEAILLADRILVMTPGPGRIAFEVTSELLRRPWRSRVMESIEVQELRRELLVSLGQGSAPGSTEKAGTK